MFQPRGKSRFPQKKFYNIDNRARNLVSYWTTVNIILGDKVAQRRSPDRRLLVVSKRSGRHRRRRQSRRWSRRHPDRRRRWLGNER